MDKVLKGKLHIGRPQCSDGSEYMVIELRDENSGCQAVEIRCSLADFVKAITSQSVDCDFEYNFSGVVGKKHEYKSVPITFPQEMPYDKNELAKIVFPVAASYEMDGWKVDKYTVLESRHKFIRNWDKKDTTINVGFNRYV